MIISRQFLVVVFLLIIFVHHVSGREKFMVKRGGRLDRLHTKTLNDWKDAAENHHRHHHKHNHHRTRRHRHKQKRHYRDEPFRLDEILVTMDSFVRPRFGR